MAARSSNAMLMPNMRMPTGYESDQRKIEMRRKIANAMLAQGIAPDKINHWTQVLAKLAQTWVGKSEEKEATKMEGEMYDRMREDFGSKIAKLQDMRANGASNVDIMNTFEGDPMMTDYIKANQDAFAKSLNEKENLVNFGGRSGVRQGDVMGKFDPGKATDSVLTRPDGTFYLNPVAQAGAQARQMVPATGADAQMLQNMTFNPSAQGTPAAQGANPGLDLSKLNPAETQVLQQEIARRNGLGQQEINAVPQGSPLTPPPSKVGPDGKPYWSVGGKWYDNPEGQ